MAKQFSVPIGIKQGCPASLEGEAVQAGNSRRSHWFKVGTEPQRGRPGRYAIVEKLMKRVGFGDWYSEKVRDKDSGEVIHECHEPHEPLSEHQRHGSAKHVVPN
jgi:hypothetical protein